MTTPATWEYQDTHPTEGHWRHAPTAPPDLEWSVPDAEGWQTAHEPGPFGATYRRRPRHPLTHDQFVREVEGAYQRRIAHLERQLGASGTS